MNSGITQVNDFEDWLDQDKFQQPVISKEFWLDTNNGLSSEPSSTYSASPDGNVQSLFDTEIMGCGGSKDMYSYNSAFTGGNIISGDTSPYIKSEEETSVQFDKDSFVQLPLPVELPPLNESESCVTFGSPTDSATKSEEQKMVVNTTNVTVKTLKKKRAPRKRLTADQKEAHNMIEKRYRININTKIAKLQRIIPWLASEETAFEVGDSLKNSNQDSSASLLATPKLNKSMILEKAVDYILYLQNNERLFELEVQRLKRELEEAKSTVGN